jgi:hypothetical protein
MWRTRPSSLPSPSGARRAMLLIAALVVAGVLAMHFLAPARYVETAQTPLTKSR